MPILDSNTLEFISRGPDQTRRVGSRLGAVLSPGHVICLSGDLGAGKTTLMQGVAQGWGSLDAVTSPTFVLVNLYRRPDKEQLYHLDAYRLGSSVEAEDLDLEMMLDIGALVVEWPERIINALPEDHLWVEMNWVAEQKRSLTFVPHGQGYQEIIDHLKQRAFGG
jgi:tRNA threonylcarbamoyladenosine biosynthesis protein TsaE